MERMKNNASSMSDRIKRNRKSVITFNLNDLESVYVPKIDRSGTDSVRLPAEIVEIVVKPNNSNMYRFLSNYGILNICYNGEDFKPGMIENNCPEDK